jgi:hypothetical protein
MAGDVLREQLVEWLDGTGSHMPFDEAVADFPPDAADRRASNVPYTFWHLLEHLRRVQRDILDYIRDPAYVSPPWPRGYWPARDESATPEAFARTISAFRSDRAALRELVLDESVDPLAVLPHTPGHTILREVRLVADHNAYHVGELAILRQVTQTWPEGGRRRGG